MNTNVIPVLAGSVDVPEGWVLLNPRKLADLGLTVDEAADAYELLYPRSGLPRERKAERMLNEVLRGRISPDEVKT